MSDRRTIAEIVAEVDAKNGERAYDGDTLYDTETGEGYRIDGINTPERGVAGSVLATNVAQGFAGDKRIDSGERG